MGLVKVRRGRQGEVVYGELCRVGVRRSELWQAWKAERRIKMVYQWKSNARIKVNADLAGKMCEEIESKVGLTARSLLDANREEGTLLHDEFEWDNEIAAEEYRLQQARHIINCLCIKPETKENKPIRAFFKIMDSESYENINVIISDEDKHQRLLQTALNELNAFKIKYRQLNELKPLFDLIDKVEE